MGFELEWLVYRQTKENGDVFVLFPRVARPGSPYSLKLQIVEADRICNERNLKDTDTLVGGVEKDQHGAPKLYHILDQHPGNMLHFKNRTWKKIPAFGAKTGLRNVLHIYRVERPGQTRGVPDLAPVIEPLKQISRYSEAEIDAAVISAFFTVFIKSETGDADLAPMDPTGEIGGSTSDEDYRLGKAAIVGLAPGEDISTANPGRPNSNFAPFVMAIMRQIGMALNIPFEILVKHFQASYSAARAALLDFWKYVISERLWFSRKFNQMVYEIWMYEAVSIGRISAPGFFSDIAMRKAYCGAEWTGPAKGMIDELKEVKAAGERIDRGISTIAEETAQLTGGDWERKHPQSVKEQKKRREDGLSGPGTAISQQQDIPDEKTDQADKEEE